MNSTSRNSLLEVREAIQSANIFVVFWIRPFVRNIYFCRGKYGGSVCVAAYPYLITKFSLEIKFCLGCFHNACGHNLSKGSHLRGRQKEKSLIKVCSTHDCTAILLRS